MGEKRDHAVLDIGNSRVKAALFRDGRMVGHRILAGTAMAIKRFTGPLSPDTPLIIADVTGRHRTLFRQLKKKHRVFVELTSRTPLPVKIGYRTPRTLGHDRVANVVGARWLFPGKPALVIDAGTCLKTDFITSKGTYTGGSIAPGMSMRYRALHQDTARLPLVRPGESPSMTGTDTRESIVAGVQTGMQYEMAGAIAAYRKKYPALKVILTGGDWIYFANPLKNTIFVAPELTLLGLHEILNYNHSGDF